MLGGELRACSYAPLTGYFRDGCCATHDQDGVAIKVKFLSAGFGPKVPPPKRIPGPLLAPRSFRCGLTFSDSQGSIIAAPVR